MEVKEGNKFYKIQWLWNILSNGLFLFGLKNRLARIGLDITPFYLVQEGVTEYEAPEIRGDSSTYTVSYFEEHEISLIEKSILGIKQNDLLKDLKSGQICVGLKHGNEIAAFMFLNKEHVDLRGRFIKLKNNEVYLHGMYTFESYRGKNLAPYLRYHSHKLADELGLDTKYSISEYFNKSTIKFKKKLNSKHLKLYVSIILFKKKEWHFLLRKYN